MVVVPHADGVVDGVGPEAWPKHHRGTTMDHYAGIDVSLEQSSVCVVDATGRIVREAKMASEPEALIAWFRGLGLGRLLAETVISEAKHVGYQSMRLDTVEDKMQSAVALYRALGFREIGPYTTNPEPGAIFMEVDLVPTPQLSLYGEGQAE